MFIQKFWRDERGIFLPYFAILLVVFVGMSAMAIDIGRAYSLQTQMQAIADALAIAGARELDQHSGAQVRSTNAMNTLVSNGLTGMGYNGSITHSVTFYSALQTANAGFGGTGATSDANTKFVGVTVAPVTIGKTFPIVGTPALAAGGQAIAGFTARAVCDMPPVFICNPYETAGMSDADATSALRTALSDATTKRKLIRMDRTNTSPGHFGFLVPPDGCKGANCLQDWIAKTHPSTCYQTPSVSLNTGAMNSVNDAFNVRFDMYSGSLKYSADYAPSVNVRKGFLPAKSGKDPWCSASQAAPYYTLPIISGRAGTTNSGGANITGISNAPEFVSGNPLVANPTNGLGNGLKVTTPITPSSITAGKMSGNGSVSANKTGAVTLDSKGITSGLPLDSNMYADPTIIFGNGDWNCADYWTINHTAGAPPGCTKTNPTISRYEVYRYEITHNLVNDWSNGDAVNGESGAPLCAGTGNGVDTPPTVDRRVFHTAIINCTAQDDLIRGGNNAQNIPIADFGKFFMTQPIGVDTPYNDKNSLYGEMTGLVSSLDGVRILNQVQLYR